MVALLQGGHAGADLDHDTRAFMAENRREKSFRIISRARELVGVANAGGPDFHQNLTRTGTL